VTRACAFTGVEPAETGRFERRERLTAVETTGFCRFGGREAGVRSPAMLRVVLAVGIVFAAACGEDECKGLGCPGVSISGADDGTSLADDGSEDASASAKTTADASATADATNSASASNSNGDSATDSDADGATDDAPTGSASASATADGDGTDTSDDETSTSGPPCRGADCPALGECFGIGVWDSCDQFCAANDAVCVDAGCGGATVVFYGDAEACVDMRSNGDSDQSCADGFELQGGGVSFGRCCCDG
jgi:hypothetical protein